jgi:hypothetical protein
MGLNHIADEDLMNDAVTCILRGHMFLPVYINPLYMTDRRWKNYASLMKWADANAAVLSQTKPLLPLAWQKTGTPEMTHKAEMPLEPYGYSHWNGERGLVEIRNPWTKTAVYALKLDKTTGVPVGAAGFSAVSLYPEPRVYGRALKYGDTLNIPVAPYETLVLSLKGHQPLIGVSEAAKVIGGQIQAAALKHEVKHIDLVKETERGLIDPLPKGEQSLAWNWMERLGLGTNWTGNLGKNAYVNHLKLEADLMISSPQAQLAVFLEGGDKLPPKYAYKLTVNGMDFTLNPFPSKTKTMTYDISHIYGPHWIFLTSELPLSKFILQAKNKISLEVIGGDDCTKMSVWVWTTKKGEANPKYPNALPPPEVLSLDGMGLAEVKF